MKTKVPERLDNDLVAGLKSRGFMQLSANKFIVSAAGRRIVVNFDSPRKADVSFDWSHGRRPYDAPDPKLNQGTMSLIKELFPQLLSTLADHGVQVTYTALGDRSDEQRGGENRRERLYTRVMQDLGWKEQETDYPGNPVWAYGGQENHKGFGESLELLEENLESEPRTKHPATVRVPTQIDDRDRTWSEGQTDDSHAGDEIARHSDKFVSRFYEGRGAALDGKRLRDNPYRRGTNDHKLWRDGFVDGLSIIPPEDHFEEFDPAAHEPDEYGRLVPVNRKTNRIVPYDENDQPYAIEAFYAGAEAYKNGRSRNNVPNEFNNVRQRDHWIRGWDVEQELDSRDPRRNSLHTVAKAQDQKGVIAVDFNRTLCSTGGPEGFGDPEPGAVEAMRELKERGYTICINSVVGDEDALRAWLDEHGVEYDYVNESPAQPEGSNPGKMNAQAYLDDRAVHYTGDWRETLDALYASGVLEKRVRKSFGLEQRDGGWVAVWPNGEVGPVYETRDEALEHGEFVEDEDEDHEDESNDEDEDFLQSIAGDARVRVNSVYDEDSGNNLIDISFSGPRGYTESIGHEHREEALETARALKRVLDECRKLGYWITYSATTEDRAEKYEHWLTKEGWVREDSETWSPPPSDHKSVSDADDELIELVTSKGAETEALTQEQLDEAMQGVQGAKKPFGPRRWHVPGNEADDREILVSRRSDSAYIAFGRPAGIAGWDFDENAQTMQPGTRDLARKLLDVVDHFASLKVPVSYRASDERRAEKYEKFFTNRGWTRVSMPNDDLVVWEPPAAEQKAESGDGLDDATEVVEASFPGKRDKTEHYDIESRVVNGVRGFYVMDRGAVYDGPFETEDDAVGHAHLAERENYAQVGEALEAVEVEPVADASLDVGGPYRVERYGQHWFVDDRRGNTVAGPYDSEYEANITRSLFPRMIAQERAQRREELERKREATATAFDEKFGDDVLGDYSDGSVRIANGNDGREISVYLHGDSASISFRRNSRTYAENNPRLQEGTIDLAKRLMGTLDVLAEHSWPVTYTAVDAKRAKVYAKMFLRAGWTLVDAPSGLSDTGDEPAGGYIWSPPVKPKKLKSLSSALAVAKTTELAVLDLSPLTREQSRELADKLGVLGYSTAPFDWDRMQGKFNKMRVFGEGDAVGEARAIVGEMLGYGTKSKALDDWTVDERVPGEWYAHNDLLGEDLGPYESCEDAVAEIEQQEEYNDAERGLQASRRQSRGFDISRVLVISQTINSAGDMIQLVQPLGVDGSGEIYTYNRRTREHEGPFDSEDEAYRSIETEEYENDEDDGSGISTLVDEDLARDMLALGAEQHGNAYDIVDAGRKIDVNTDPEIKTASISFDWVGDSDYKSREQLQPGTIDLVREMFPQILMMLAKNGYKVTYSPTDARRARIYDRVMREQGWKNPDAASVWNPPVGEPKSSSSNAAVKALFDDVRRREWRI